MYFGVYVYNLFGQTVFDHLTSASSCDYEYVLDTCHIPLVHILKSQKQIQIISRVFC